MSMGAFNAMVRKAVRPAHKSRIRIFDNSITTAEATQTYSLLRADDDPDYDITTNGDAATAGTNIAECLAQSRIESIDLTVSVQNLDVAKATEVLIYKDPDVVLGAVAPSTLFTSDVTLTTMEVRKRALKYMIGFGSSGTDGFAKHVRISRSALKRNRVMHDLDELKITITNNNSVDSLSVFIVGTITWR